MLKAMILSLALAIAGVVVATSLTAPAAADCGVCT
jgi:hypothetical protein